MKPYRSVLTHHRTLRSLPALLVLILALVGAQLDAAAPITDKHVKRRVELMTSQKAAITTLADMMAGRMVFNAAKARAARRSLIKSTGDIRKRFKKPRMEPHSHARPLIWQQWEDFETRAERAEDAVRRSVHIRAMAYCARSRTWFRPASAAMRPIATRPTISSRIDAARPIVIKR